MEVSSNVIPLGDWLGQPPLIEVTAENEHLLEMFRHGLVTRRVG